MTNASCSHIHFFLFVFTDIDRCTYNKERLWLVPNQNLVWKHWLMWHVNFADLNQSYRSIWCRNESLQHNRKLYVHEHKYEFKSFVECSCI